MSTKLPFPTETYSIPKDQYLDAYTPAQLKLNTLASSYDELVRPEQQVFRRQGLAVPLLITIVTVGGSSAGAATAGARPIDSFNINGHMTKPSSGRVEAVTSSAVLQQADCVERELRVIRTLTGLSVNDIARLCGIKRRQVYNLLDGGETEPHRAANIRGITSVIEEWSHRFARPEALRSALLAPLNNKREDFITLVSSADDPPAIAAAIALFGSYIQRLGSANPVIRVGSSSTANRKEAVELLRSLYGEDSPPVSV